MDQDYEVQTRKWCPKTTCSGGWVMGTRKEKCGNCNGTGYVYEWLDLRTLIRQIINI